MINKSVLILFSLMQMAIPMFATVWHLKGQEIVTYAQSPIIFLFPFNYHKFKLG